MNRLFIKIKERMYGLIVLSLILSLVLTVPVIAQQKVNLMVVGGWITQPPYKMEEKLWTETIPEALNGKINTTMTCLDQISVTGAAVIRQMEDGIFDVVSIHTDYIVSDYPELTGLDLPCLTFTIDMAAEAEKAYRSYFEEYAEKNFHAKLLSVGPYPGQFLYLREPISGLQDLKGRKIRGSGWSTIKFIEALGATGVNITYSEVTQALQRGVVDGGVTGTLSGYNSKWGEVTSYIYPLPLGGWDHSMMVMNLDTWNKFTPEEQEIIQTLVHEEFEKWLWEYSAQATQEGIDHLTGSKEAGEIYEYGEPNNLKLIEVTPEDVEYSKQILREVVIPEWSKQISDESLEVWNQTIGNVVGIIYKK